MSTISTFIRSRSSLINHSRFQRKIYTRFQTKKVQKPYPLERYIPIWLLKGFFYPGVLSKILLTASFICLLRSPQLGTLLKDLYDQQETLWIIRLPTFLLFYLPLWNYVHKVVYLPYNQFWRSKILPIVHISIFLNAAALKTLAMYSQKTSFSQHPLLSKKQVQSFWPAFSLERSLA